jgi:hypothetical protein
MATIITGHDVTLVIGGSNYHPQVTSALLTVVDSQETFDVLGARVYKTVRDTTAGVPYQLELTMLADWGTAGGLCQALSTAAINAPDTSLAFTMTVVGKDGSVVATGSVFPTIPPVSGAGFTVSEVTFTLPGDRTDPLDYTLPTV